MSDVRICHACDLVFEPDERTHKDAGIRCPRCGANLIEAARQKRGFQDGEN